MHSYQCLRARLPGIVLLLALALSTLASHAQIVVGKSAVVTTEQVRAELMAHAPQGVEPGKPVWIGLQLTHQPEWHTYWKNPGDSGLATQLAWNLPSGVTAGEIQWPTPKKIPIGNLANYGYEDTVLLAVPLTVAPGFSASQLAIQLKAQWLVCRRECVPQEGEFNLNVPVRSSTAMQGAAFDAAAAAQPRTSSGKGRIELEGQTLKVSVAGLPAALQGKTLAFFPETGGIIETAGKWTQAWQGADWTARIPLSPDRTESPSAMPIVLASTGDGAARQAWKVEATVQGAWPAAVVAGASTALEASLRAASPAGPSAGNDLSFWAALAGALLGGMMLNLMPCVFPILALKVLNFTQHARDRRAHRISGIAYSTGVIVSFVALGGLVLALRAGGESLGWGFQLQSPAMVAALAMLFTLIGLNLLGVYEIGTLLPHRVSGLRAGNPTLDSLLSGVLAVAIASPCTAPFMGASLGLALGLPAAQALLIFASIGIGMALPYLLASMIPGVARALPRPGAWMNTLRILMAFPMFGTVVWLVWVLGMQSGIDGAAALLGLLVALAALVWTLTLKGRTRVVLASVALLLLSGGIWTLGKDIALEREPARTATSDSRWQAWEPGKVDQLLATGQPVFVDFTAAWCVTCQYNKRTTLANEAVLGDLADKKVALLRADWTRRDPAIEQALSQLGRHGVPVYVVYRAGSAPQVLSEVLSVSEVRAALARL
jgi:thiol:disulfide interchange protein DsbD